uniref:Uncharacterized protein n=1 Tax=Arundo donax TaxID=35708 RepID=A0A0A9CBB7_ARUDO
MSFLELTMMRRRTMSSSIARIFGSKGNSVCSSPGQKTQM